MTASNAAEIDEVAVAIGQRQMRLDPPHGQTASNDSDAGQPADVPLPAPATAIAENLLEVEEPTAEMVAAAAGEDVEAQREQMQLELAQLADHLRERVRQIDRREATVNAREAQLEADLRASRVWLQERELAFQERERQLEQQILELRENSQGSTIAPEVPTPLDGFDPIACLSEIAQREQQLQLREDELRERRLELDRQSAALGHAQQLWRQHREQEEKQLNLQRERLARDAAAEKDQATRDCEQFVAQREQQLRIAEQMVAQQARQLESERVALTNERQVWHQQRARQREAIDELRASTEIELGQYRARLNDRQEWMERQKAGLEQAREEALSLHRQAIEMRLIGEQLWSQISGAIAPAAVSEVVAQLRTNLAEQYRLEEQMLAARRAELVELSEKIAAQHRDIVQFKDGVRQWAAARQDDLQRQGEALAVREQSLDAQQAKMREAEQRWHLERGDYERQIADLKNALQVLPSLTEC